MINHFIRIVVIRVRFILKDGSYSKKLRIGSLKKIEFNGREMFTDQNYQQEFPQTYSVTVE
jgi:hypothetical protein